MDEIPSALIGFQGRLAAGIGKALRIFDLGKKKLLRKVENKSFSTAIVSLSTQGSRLLVGDMQDSVSYVVYKPAENRLIVFADDVVPRWTTCATMVDYDTVYCLVILSPESVFLSLLIRWFFCGSGLAGIGSATCG